MKIYVDEQVEQVSQFRYLDSLISEYGYCTKAIWSRTELVKKAFLKKKKLLTDNMNLELEKRIMKCLVWTVTLSVSETWTLTLTEED